MKTDRSIYCCIPIEFIQPWDQDEAIRKVKELGLGNVVFLGGTYHVGNSDEERRRWKERFPRLAERIDATPRFPERPKHGMAVLFEMPIESHIEQLQLCRELGLKVLSSFPSLLHLPPEDFTRIYEAGRDVVLMEMVMCENLSILGSTLSPEQLRQIDGRPVASYVEENLSAAICAKTGPSIFDDPGALDFQTMHKWFVGRFRAAGETMRARGVDPLGAVEASSQMRLTMEAGIDIPVLELVPHEPLRGLAAVRGAARAYGKPIWGVHTAMGYYRAPTDGWTPERLRIAYNLFFAGGASIFSECNLPLRNWGSCSAFFSIPASPSIRQGELECREFDDPICVLARDVVAEHYRFTQFHNRPEGGPRVPTGYLLGHLDSWTGGAGERMWMLDQPGFLAPEALQTWRHFDSVFDVEGWYSAPRKYYWQADPAKPLRHGTPPCGQVDLVPVEASLDTLAGYGCLSFLGWNTMTQEHYAKLKDYVHQGGTLFLSVPHLSTRTRTDRPQEFIHDGDVRDLCGVRIAGPGTAVEEVFLAEQASCERHAFPQGTLYLEEAALAGLELHGARVLAHPRGKPEQPVLLEYRLGKGVVYLLATWEYPGAGLDAFITDILRTLAEAEQAEIAMEGRDVFYSVYDGILPSGAPFSLVYLVNHDLYGQAAYPVLLLRGRRVPIRVDRDLRIAWVCDDLVVAPHDRFVEITDVRREGREWSADLASIPQTPNGGAQERRIQIASMGAAVRSAVLDGHTLTLETGVEGDMEVRCKLSGSHLLRIELSE